MKKIYIVLNVIAFVWMTGGVIWAQQTWSGTITDENGLPLPGATIVVENTNRGVTTDFDGNFSISSSTGEILVISYVGYTSQRIPLGANANLSIQMATANELEEVIVTSLGIKREKQALGYAVSEVDSQSLEQRAEGDIGRILTGENHKLRYPN